MTAPGRIRVLIVEDDRSDAELNLRELERGGLAVEHRIAHSEREFERELDEFKPDVIVSDFTVSRFDGMAALALAHRQAPETPFIFVSGMTGEEHAIRALKNGAVDYVLKENLPRLPVAVERALHDAKGRRARRNERVAGQVDLENHLRRAVDRRELFLHFQPKVDMESRRIVGLEALMRWRGPDQRLVSPLKFVPVLEETGLILDAGRQAIEGAAALHRHWRKLGLEAPRIAVNVSALQLRQRSFVDDVIAAFGGPDSGVDLEITESLLMEDIEESIRKLRALREAGANIALDDFGTGYSSLSYLSRLPIDTVKIDRSFIHSMTENADATSIVSTIISLAKSLRHKVVAEGVETEEQAQLLRLLRCDQMQGYLFSPPVDKDKVEILLRGS